MTTLVTAPSSRVRTTARQSPPDRPVRALPGGRNPGEGIVAGLAMDLRVPVDDPRNVFSDGTHLYLSSGLRRLTKFRLETGLEPVAEADLGEDGVEGFAGFDRESGTVWAVSHGGTTLRLLDRDLRLRRSVPIPRDEGIYFTLRGRAYFIDAYNGPFTVHRVERDGLRPLPVAVPASPFARDFLDMAYGYPFPAFYYKTSQILLGFDGTAFHRLARFKGLDFLSYGRTRLPGEPPLTLTICNDSRHRFRTCLAIFGESAGPLATIPLRDMCNSGACCVVGRHLVVLSHFQGEVRLLDLDRLAGVMERPDGRQPERTA